MIEKSLRMEKIHSHQINALNHQEQALFLIFLKKKFAMPIQLGESKTRIPKHNKSKRNEEILKFVLKSYFKFLCKKLKKKFLSKTFFQIKKLICQEIIEQIASSLNVENEIFFE